MARLLEELWRWDGSTGDITRILAAFESAQDGAGTGIGPQMHTRDPSGRSPTGREPAPSRIPEPARVHLPGRVPPVLVETLSERELEVLQLIAQGLTNQEIASRLFVSLNTVKAHTRNIYGKLDVHSRTQAVARSGELGLLAHGPA
jgi:DNA-binding NarL/FixJ family response regulator